MEYLFGAEGLTMERKPKICINKDKFTGQYRCRVRINGKNNHIGYFSEANKAYHEALIFIKNIEQQ